MGQGFPIVGLRVPEGRSGSTLVMQLLATSAQIVFDERYPAEYRFLSYFARISELMTEPFDHSRHTGVTDFFFAEEATWGPVPFHSELVDVQSLRGPLLQAMWKTFSAHTRRRDPEARYYAEKLAVPLELIVGAGLDLRLIDLVRDPRDMLASIRAFTSRGIEGFGRRVGQTEDDYLHALVDRLEGAYAAVLAPSPAPRLVVRYEDLVSDLPHEAGRIGDWLGVELDAGSVTSQRDRYLHHVTTESPEASIGRWHRDLPPADARFITSRLHETMAQLGYER